MIWGIPSRAKLLAKLLSDDPNPGKRDHIACDSLHSVANKQDGTDDVMCKASGLSEWRGCPGGGAT